MDISILPIINACLNAVSAFLLVLGYFLVRRRWIRGHKICMLGAFTASSLFLISYLYYHYHHGATRFPAEGRVRVVYLLILFSHSVLAVVQVPLILTTLYRAFKGQFQGHVRIARITLPIWLYVSITGVVVYWMLYRVEY